MIGFPCGPSRTLREITKILEKFPRWIFRGAVNRLDRFLTWPFLFFCVALAGCSQKDARVVVIYASQDQVYAEPLLNDFTKKTGIEARAVYDSEAVKTVGLVNRLLAERDHPQCDVFWNNEEFRTHQLTAQGIFREIDPWRAIGYRSRRIVINTNLFLNASGPTSLLELTNVQWRGKLALAYPLFGTTAAHFLALREHWGESRWLEWCRMVLANRPMLVDGNSVVVKLVGRGEAWVGLTDSDDIAAGQREGLPVASVPLSDESLLIPNTLGVIRNAPHAEAAQRFLEFMQQPEVLERLVRENALEGKSPADAKTPTLKPNWDALIRELPQATTKLKEIFLR